MGSKFNSSDKMVDKKLSLQLQNLRIAKLKACTYHLTVLSQVTSIELAVHIFVYDHAIAVWITTLDSNDFC